MALGDGMADQEIKREKMYGWYDPGHLLETGIRVGIAQIFGEFLDRRELFGDRNTAKPAPFDKAHNYSVYDDKDAGLWIDFVADTGDGWDPTHAVARLLARGGLRFREDDGSWEGLDNGEPSSPGDIQTQRGRILIFGGDEVYSTASHDAYRTRFEVPFAEAARAEGTANELKDAHVYALPGNHDWYDGLNAFMTMFVTRRPGGPTENFGAGRLITGRLARQTRSYFALKLPDNWWLLGADAQLSGYIDQGQIAFFDDLAQHHMEPGSNIILCAATPSWSYVHLDGPPEKVFRNHGYLEDVVTGMMRPFPDGRRHHLRLVLTGDAHHYARYIERRDDAEEKQTSEPQTDIPQDARCYLTWGGGGAFLHPTHQLDDVCFDWRYPPPPPVSPLNVVVPEKAEKSHRRRFNKTLVYPDVDTSRYLAWHIPLFGLWNFWFSVLMFAFGLVVAWALAGAADLAGKRVPDTIRDADTVCGAAWQLSLLLLTFPWVLLTCIALGAALVYFSAAQRMFYRVISGTAHFLAYLFSFFMIFLVVARSLPDDLSPPWGSIWLVVLTALGTAIVAPLIMGCYLSISLMFRRHWNEAFSSLRIKGHKGFLRLHIKDGAVTVYPIAMDKVPKRGEGRLETRLIERPIRIEGSAPSPPASKPKRKPRMPRRPAADA